MHAPILIGIKAYVMSLLKLDHISLICYCFSYTHIQEKIASITEIPADRQKLLLGDAELKDIVEMHDQIQTFPKSVQNAQLFLFEKENYDFRHIPYFNLRE